MILEVCQKQKMTKEMLPKIRDLIADFEIQNQITEGLCITSYRFSVPGSEGMAQTIAFHDFDKAVVLVEDEKVWGELENDEIQFEDGTRITLQGEVLKEGKAPQT
jgi:hypothetical protein